VNRPDVAERRFDGRVAIVTGAGGGLGRQHALLLARRGASVVVNDVGGVDPVSHRDIGHADRVVAEIVAAGGQAVAAPVSVSDEGAGEALVAAALDAFGRIDIVINNAGILRSSPFAEMDAATWRAVLGVHLDGTYHLCRAAWPHFVQQSYGRIVNTSSNSGLLGIPGSTAYGSAKAGIYGLTRVLAIEGRGVGINVNAIAPVAFTAMSVQSKAAPESWRSGEGDDWTRRLDPALVSPVVGWLAHEACTTTGEVFSVGGGLVARFFLGLTPGVIDDALDIESVESRMAEICSEDAYDVLRTANDEFKMMRRRLLG
jgi:NAD(P)-dependent dehydrogenase (short-subunit alcohol dehydrogenase family)